MKVYALLWLRGFIIVFFTAANVVNISQHRWGAAFLTGCAISYVWRLNARNSIEMKTFGADMAYAFGAGCGTVCGAVLAAKLF